MSEQRIIFVGMHNKPMLKPLCGSTKSGKLINRIIERFPKHTCVKTNLYDVDYFPIRDEEKYQLAKDWIDRICPELRDIVVLLGAEVHENFIYNSDKVIRLPHPASMWSHEEMNGFIERATNKINKHL